MDIIDILNRYGFATLAAIGLGWFVYFIYIYITTQIKVKGKEELITIYKPVMKKEGA